MPLHADLYLDRIDLARYSGPETCNACRVDSLDELLDRLRSGQLCPGQCPHWPPERVEAFRMAINAGESLPAIPSLEIPRPTDTGMFDLNGATADSPALITGNSQLTHEVLQAVLSTTTAPIRLISVETGGHTVDMSLVYKTLTPQAIGNALGVNEAETLAVTGRIILPGLAGAIAQPVSEILGRPIEVGPVCAAELPLYFGSAWER